MRPHVDCSIATEIVANHGVIQSLREHRSLGLCPDSTGAELALRQAAGLNR